MTENVERYLELKEKSKNALDLSAEDVILEEMDNLYFELNNDEIAHIETLEIE